MSEERKFAKSWQVGNSMKKANFLCLEILAYGMKWGESSVSKSLIKGDEKYYFEPTAIFVQSTN